MSSVLSSMADVLSAHTWVSEAYEGHADTSAAPRCGAVVVLNSAGVMVLREHGRQALIDQLQSHLVSHAIAPPQVWRLLDTYSAQTICAQTVDSLLQAPRPSGSIVLGEQSTDGKWSLELLVPVDLRHFSGHFPTAPVLPGVIQVAWALDLAASRLHTPAQCRSIEALKFQQFLRPGDRVTLTLSTNSANGKLYFTYRQGEKPYSSGRLVWGART